MRWRAVVTLTVLGLYADIALCLDVATRFALDGEWGPAVGYLVLGSCTVLMLTTIGWQRVKAVTSRAEREGR